MRQPPIWLTPANDGFAKQSWAAIAAFSFLMNCVTVARVETPSTQHPITVRGENPRPRFISNTDATEDRS